jgi:hypothetical protein
MTRRRAFLLGMVLVVAAWFLLPAMCREPPTPEGRVRAAIQAVADGMGDGDIVAALAPVSRKYADLEGGDFTMVRALLFREIRSRGPITITLGPMEVLMDADGVSAEARFVALLMDGLDLGALDIHADSADAWHFTVQLRLEDDDEWRVVSHQRRGVEPQDVFR